MSDHLNKNVLLIGTTQMAMDYLKVLNALACKTIVVGRGEKNAAAFEEQTGVKPVTGGIDDFLEKVKAQDFDAVIVAVGVEKLKEVTAALINKGFHNILLEKPGALHKEEIQSLAKHAAAAKASVLIAYNRRFYSSVLEAEKIIARDGGVKSFSFEFTEWSHVIETLGSQDIVKANWFLANSTHPTDLAFYLGGMPVQMKSFSDGHLAWHKKAVFAGAGITDKGALFSYSANWAAPGRWVVEILTDNFRLYFKPMEDLQIQNKGSVAVNKVEIDNSLDVQFKPGLYLQTKSFLTADYSRFSTIGKQAEMAEVYEHIVNGN
ncbi:MAG: Gfo/Idh/MocA family oxidoreductase [Flavobacteriales bacterium]